MYVKFKNTIPSILLISIFFFISFCTNIEATEIHGNDNPGDYGGGHGSGANCSDSNIWYNGTSGLRISILDKNGNRLTAPVDFYKVEEYYNIPGLYGEERVGRGCSKIEYIKGKCIYNTLPSIYNIDSVISSYPGFLGNGNTRTQLKAVFDNLKKNNYENLKKLIKKTGYNCIDNVGSSGICSISKMNETYIVLEPMALFDDEFATAYELRRAGVDCFLYNKWGILASFKAANGNYFGINLTDKVPSSSDFSAAIKNHGSINGLMIYSLSDIVNIPKKGKLTLQKQNSVNGKLITSSNATFQIYDKANCTGNVVKTVTTSGGKITVELNNGTYSVKETGVPSGYEAPKDNCVIKNVSLNLGDNKTQTVVNEPNCNTRLADLGTNPSKSSLNNLYKLYPSFNGLLNFSNPSCSATSCNYSKNASCLSGDFGNTTFNSNNVSCFNEKIDIDGITAYCQTNFQLLNKLGNTNFFAKSGMMPINKASLDSAIAATGTVNKKCLVIGDSIPNEANIGKYSDYVTNVNFGGRSLFVKSQNNTSELDKVLKQTNRSGSWFEYSHSVDYYLNTMYAKNGTGETSYDKCTNCKFLGYGVISKLSDVGIKEIPFSITFTNKRVNNLGYTNQDFTNKCTATLTPELVINDELNLEFRLIDTSNPFPGKNGTGRKVGSNWCSENDCQNNNELVTNVILSSPNSYGRVPSTNEVKNPIYRITLTPDIIKSIRNYNKDNPYDDYTLKCDEEGNNCKSTFLEKFGIARLS